MTETCPCQSELTYEECCGPFITKAQLPETAEQLMRSRYTAFTKAEIDYIRDTRHPESTNKFDEKSVSDWANKSKWLGFDLVAVKAGTKEDEGGTVEFVAHYSQNGKKQDHHEVSLFQKFEGQWYFVDGDPVTAKTVKREAPKVGRNEPCPCGSGKKFKKCCG